MNKVFIFLVSIFVFTSLTSTAAVYKGQREFVKRCVKCHKAGQGFIATKNKKEWKQLMNANGKKLADIHLDSKDTQAVSSHEYFNDRKFTSKAKHLKQFLMEYAKDSGNVPACN